MLQSNSKSKYSYCTNNIYMFFKIVGGMKSYMYKRGIEILKSLNKNNYEAYIIGGYPRDRYLNIDSNDIDICTSATPDDLIKIFPNADYTYKKYGNVNIDSIQLTTYRKDSYNNNRYPVDIIYVDTLKEDLKRRDFIINTLCIDSSGNYIDLLNAKDDIDNKIIRMVGNSYDKIIEDPLRILRAVRFASILDFKLDDNLICAIKKYGYLVKTISYKRKKKELDKIFNNQNKKIGIKLILEYNLDEYLEIYNLDKIDYNMDILKQIDINNKYKEE